jgi:hypothetical protein
MGVVAARPRGGNSGLADSTGLLDVGSTGPRGRLAWISAFLVRSSGSRSSLQIEKRLAVIEGQVLLPTSEALQQ